MAGGGLRGGRGRGGGSMTVGSMKKNRKNDKKECEDGIDCKFQDEYQHNLEFSHTGPPKHKWPSAKRGRRAGVGRRGRRGGGAASVAGSSASGARGPGLTDEQMRAARLEALQRRTTLNETSGATASSDIRNWTAAGSHLLSSTRDGAPSAAVPPIAPSAVGTKRRRRHGPGISSTAPVVIDETNTTTTDTIRRQIPNPAQRPVPMIVVDLSD